LSVFRTNPTYQYDDDFRLTFRFLGIKLNTK
jgi:hypothetical protein